MLRVTILLFPALFLAIHFSPAQGKKKNKGKRDFEKIEAPEIHYVEPDTTTLFIDNELKKPSLAEEDTSVNEPEEDTEAPLKKELSIVSEDTSSFDEGLINIVEISEKLKIDCVWVTSQEYYSIWDSYNVNPYEIDGAKFTDTIHLNLYDTTSNLGWALPLDQTKINSDFGMRHYRWHYGTDLDLDVGDSVRAVFDGIVRIAKYDRGGYGYYIMLRHKNGLETLYGHLSKYNVKVGEIVKAGDVIGLGGNTGRSTGPHLHFEVRYQGNAIDPITLYDFNTNTLLFDTLQVTPTSFAYLKEARKVIYHKIRRGDTLSGISHRYGVSINTICRLNGISRRTTLRIGRRLRIR